MTFGMDIMPEDTIPLLYFSSSCYQYSNVAAMQTSEVGATLVPLNVGS
jgi:hypothetical protein